jgi:hypothetical protein
MQIGDVARAGQPPMRQEESWLQPLSHDSSPQGIFPVLCGHGEKHPVGIIPLGTCKPTKLQI